MKAHGLEALEVVGLDPDHGVQPEAVASQDHRGLAVETIIAAPARPARTPTLEHERYR